MSGAEKDWGSASCIALAAALERNELGQLDPSALAAPWGRLASMAIGHPRESAERGAVPFAEGLSREACRALDIGGPAWVAERLQTAVGQLRDQTTEYLMSEAALIGSRLQSAASLAVNPPVTTPPPIFRRIRDVPEREIEWLWDRRIPWGMPVLLAGDGGVGKSTVAQHVGARLTRGEAMPGGTLDRPRGVLLLTTEEDTAAVIRPRMRLMGADLARVHDLDPETLQPLKLPSGGQLIDDLCAVEDIGLIVVDTGPSFLDEGLSSHREEGIRAFFTPLNRIAQKHRLAVLVLAHLNKATGGDSGHRIMGGAAWRNVPRNVLIVAAPPGENPRETHDRVLAVEKSNVGAFPPAVEFRLVSNPDDPTRAGIEWGQERSDLHAGDLVRAPLDPEERSATDEACEWLEQMLADGELPKGTVTARARAEGFTDKVLRSARERLKITTTRRGSGRGHESFWALQSTHALGGTSEWARVGEGTSEEPGNHAVLDPVNAPIEPTRALIPGKGTSERYGPPSHVLAAGDGFSIEIERGDA